MIFCTVRLSPTVDTEDVQEAIRLIKEALMGYAVDPVTGRLDMDLVTTGRSSSSRELFEKLKAKVRDVISKKNQVKFDDLLVDVNAGSSIVSLAVSIVLLAGGRGWPS